MTDKIETLRQQGELIALHLGKPWKFNALDDPNDWRFTLIDGYGRSLLFRCEYGASQKYRISGLFSACKTGKHYGKCHSIGVSRSRNAKAIPAVYYRIIWLPLTALLRNIRWRKSARP